MDNQMNNAVQTALSNNNSFSVCETACNFDVSEFTLCGCLHDCLSHYKNQVSKQLLLLKKELNLVNVLCYDHTRLELMGWVKHKNCVVSDMRQRVKRQLNHENVELTLSRLS